jgi:chromosomal replication initiation ATPase DnaA
VNEKLLEVRRERARLLAEEVSKETGVPVECLFGREKDPEIVAARHRFWLMLRDTGLSYPAIAAAVGADHTSIRYAVVKAGRVAKKVRVA